jgi:hypothetical protein
LAKKKQRPHYKPKKQASVEAVIEEAAPAKLPWKFDRTVALESVSLLLLPLVAFWVMRFIPINQNNYLDPYIYTGYIHAFPDLIARFGVTYYSVRFGLIVPAQWFAKVFGPMGGFFAFRYALAVIAGAPLYYTVKRNFSQPVAVMTVAGMMTSPYFARTLLWDYPDAAGVPFLVAAVCLFLLEERPSLWRDGLAGACTAMAVNSNFFEVSLIGIFGVVWLSLALLFRRPLKEVMKRIGGVALGGFLITLLGCLYYWRALGRPVNIYYVTLGMAFSQARGGAKAWRTPGAGWIVTQIQVLVPVFLVVCCVFVARWRRAALASLVVVGFGVAVTAFYYAEQFVLASNILEFFYYFSYFMPAVFLMLAFLWQALWERTRGSAPAFIGLGLAALLAQWLPAIWAGRTLPYLTLSQWLALAGVAIVTVFLATRDWRLPAVQGMLPWLALVLLGVSFTAGMASYGGMIRNGPAAANMEMDVYRVALQFVGAVPKQAEHPGLIRFWYNNRVGNSINSVQSTYLWGYSKLNASPPADPGLPHLGEFQLQSLQNPELRYLVLLCESREECSQGLAALTQAGVVFKPEDDRILASGHYRIYYQLVELVHGPQ